MSVVVKHEEEQLEKCVLVLKVFSLQPVINYDTNVKVNILNHTVRVINEEQIVICEPSNIAQKCIVLKCDNVLYAIKLLIFELD